jgi:hypothetical protein
VLTYPKKKLQIHFVGTFVNAYEKAGVTLMGESGTIYLDRGRMELRPEPNADYKAEDMILGTQPRGADFSDVPDGELLHIGNWIEAIRERKEPSSPVEPAVQAAAAAHWANLAYRENRVVKIPG